MINNKLLISVKMNIYFLTNVPPIHTILSSAVPLTRLGDFGVPMRACSINAIAANPPDHFTINEALGHEFILDTNDSELVKV